MAWYDGLDREGEKVALMGRLGIGVETRQLVDESEMTAHSQSISLQEYRDFGELLVLSGLEDALNAAEAEAGAGRGPGEWREPMLRAISEIRERLLGSGELGPVAEAMGELAAALLLNDAQWASAWDVARDVWARVRRPALRSPELADELHALLSQTLDPVLKDIGHCCGNPDRPAPAVRPCCDSCEREFRPHLEYFRSGGAGLGDDVPRLVCGTCHRRKRGGEGGGEAWERMVYEEAEALEDVLKCSSCGCELHPVCLIKDSALVHASILCKKCDKGAGLRPPHSAFESLPTTELSDFLEKTLQATQATKVTDGDVPQGELHKLLVRVLTSATSTLPLQPRFAKLKPDLAGSSFKKLYVIAAQVVDGVAVPFFGMWLYVGSEDSIPSSKDCLYFSYLESLFFFQGSSPLRKALVKASLTQTLYFFGKRGVKKGLIWSCAPASPESFYVFPGRPGRRKAALLSAEAAAKDSKARQASLDHFYRQVLGDAVRQGHARSFENLTDHLQANPPDSLTALPFFDGDIVPEMVERAIGPPAKGKKAQPSEAQMAAKLPGLLAPWSYFLVELAGEGEPWAEPLRPSLVVATRRGFIDRCVKESWVFTTARRAAHALECVALALGREAAATGETRGLLVALAHCATCRRPGECGVEGCRSLAALLAHQRTCRRRSGRPLAAGPGPGAGEAEAEDDCPQCLTLLAFAYTHAQACDLGDCSFPYCSVIKEDLRRSVHRRLSLQPADHDL